MLSLGLSSKGVRWLDAVTVVVVTVVVVVVAVPLPDSDVVVGTPPPLNFVVLLAPPV